ncbi:potassium-transporting ATPase subunit KdpB [Psychrobacter sp. JB385]|uniref:potassium-transporting ATPase subunit KdpB n=1 Tax=Psychrobacter sp. JB385 TaxID=1434841 RepID=UPI00097ED41A|nr:potassium-transporting ATPase subunit KdpB [Psychrobacter sp. JB385]SJN33605.1 Potassium-transporting ATPase B chain [Psychrobacter sp. JB385]
MKVISDPNEQSPHLQSQQDPNQSGAPKKPTQGLLDPALIKPALKAALLKLDPRVQWRNPVMFVVYIGSLLTSILAITMLTQSQSGVGFTLAITFWLWFTLLFANFAEALAEGRSKAQAASLKQARQDVQARKLTNADRRSTSTMIQATALNQDDIVLVNAGEIIPADGEVIEGLASVDESAITGESAPVIRESGGDFNAVTGGTKVLSDWLMIRITQAPGQGFLDRMISLVEGAKRTKTPNEIALTILLVALTLIFLMVCVTLLPFSQFAVLSSGNGEPISIVVLVALLVCLIPTTIGGLLSAIGVAGMSRMMQANVIATSGRAVEAAGDVDVLLLDKTGTITYGNRQAALFVPAQGVTESQLAEVALISSLTDETPEGRSIVKLAQSRFDIDDKVWKARSFDTIEFTAQTRMSGTDIDGRHIRKGAFDAIIKWVEAQGGKLPNNLDQQVAEVARRGSTPLLVADSGQLLGIIELKDVVKSGIKERFAELRKMGITTVMITGDNPLTAAAIAAEAGVDDFMAEATPEQKLERIRSYQRQGKLVAMTGDGTNDAPALAQADVAVAMNSGTQAAKEAANMVDLDSNPTKLIEVVQTGKQMLMTRGALTTFSLANDIAKYFAIIPAAFASTYPALGVLDIMQLGSPKSAILSAIIFNALIIVFLIPLALRGVTYRPDSAINLLRRNLMIYGLGGLLLPFVGIKLIDLIINALHLV